MMIRRGERWWCWWSEEHQKANLAIEWIHHHLWSCLLAPRKHHHLLTHVPWWLINLLEAFVVAVKLGLWEIFSLKRGKKRYWPWTVFFFLGLLPVCNSITTYTAAAAVYLLDFDYPISDVSELLQTLKIDNTQVIQAGGGDTATSEVPTSFCVVDFVLLKSGAVACCFHDIHKP